MATKTKDPNSKRSKRRAARKFQSLELSTRKGRRAARRSDEKCTIAGKIRKPGEKATRETVIGGAKYGFLHTAGGSMRHY